MRLFLFDFREFRLGERQKMRIDDQMSKNFLLNSSRDRREATEKRKEKKRKKDFEWLKIEWRVMKFAKIHSVKKKSCVELTSNDQKQ